MGEAITPSGSDYTGPAPHEQARGRESFGHSAEGFIAESLESLPTVGLAEVGTPEDDRVEHVDLWLQFEDWDMPVGVQLTLSDSPERMGRKIEEFPKQVQKDDQPDSRIKGKGKVCLAVLVRGDKKDFSGPYATYLKMRETDPEVQASQVIPPHIQAKVYRQILTGYIEALNQYQPALVGRFQEVIMKNSRRTH